MSQGVRGALGLIVFCLCLPAIFPAGLAAAPTPQVVAAGQVLRGHFVQDRQLAGFAKPLRSEGSFALVPGRGLIWRGEKPFPNTTIISSAGILQVVNGQPAVHLPASRLPGLNHLYAALGAAVCRKHWAVAAGLRGDAVEQRYRMARCAEAAAS